jgi:hypothetical protein
LTFVTVYGNIIIMTTSHQEALFGTPDNRISTDERRGDLDRLEMVHSELGFIPHSRRELNYAMLALDNRDLPGGYARFLNEVLRHQQKSVSLDPPAALRSIVTSIRGFAETTRGDKTALLALGEELQPFAGNQQFLELNNVSNISGWSLQPLTKRGLGLVNRQLTVEQAIRDGEWPDIDDLEKEESIADMVISRRVYEVLAAVDAGISGADNRNEFWVECLEAATNHGAVRAIALQALNKLGVVNE